MTPKIAGAKIPFFIWSFDGNRDVLGPMLTVLRQHCDPARLDLYVGRNTEDASLSRILPVTTLSAPRGDWASESRVQLQALKARTGQSHVVGCLDDFIFLAPIDHDRLEALHARCEAEDIDYLALKPCPRTLWRDLAAWASAPAPEIQPIPRWAYYPHSLQLAIWKLDYLIALVDKVSDPWRFELQRPGPTARVFQVTRPGFRYQHCVEKGKWDTTAEAVLAPQLPDWDKGTRASQTYRLGRWHLPLQRLKFKLFGYASPHLKTKTRKLTRMKHAERFK